MVRDLDVNWHVNNIVYAQWAFEGVPLKMWKDYRLQSIEIAYRAEVRHGDTVRVGVAIDSGEGDVGARHKVTNAVSGVEVTRMRTRWALINAPA